MNHLYKQLDIGHMSSQHVIFNDNVALYDAIYIGVLIHW
jgi:hypothetical protein